MYNEEKWQEQIMVHKKNQYKKNNNAIRCFYINKILQ